MVEYDCIVESGDRYYITHTRIAVRNVVDVLATGEMTIPELAAEWDVSEHELHAAVDVYENHEEAIRDRRRHDLGQEGDGG